VPAVAVCAMVLLNNKRHRVRSEKDSAILVALVVVAAATAAATAAAMVYYITGTPFPCFDKRRQTTMRAEEKSFENVRVIGFAVSCSPIGERNSIALRAGRTTAISNNLHYSSVQDSLA